MVTLHRSPPLERDNTLLGGTHLYIGGVEWEGTIILSTLVGGWSPFPTLTEVDNPQLLGGGGFGGDTLACGMAVGGDDNTPPPEESVADPFPALERDIFINQISP